VWWVESRSVGVFQDRVALKLGRLIMTAMVEKGEDLRPTSRFFVDHFLRDLHPDAAAHSAQPFSMQVTMIDGG
jgi:hypothetical protein